MAMSYNIKIAKTINVVEITEAEKEQAAKTRKAFEEMLDEMNSAFEHLELLNGALSGITDTAPLEGLRKLFKQYKRRIQGLFNEFIEKLEIALNEAYQTVSDSEMERILDTVVAEVREIRDGVQKLLILLKEPQDSGFVKGFTSIVERLKTRKDSLSEICTESLADHINYDILGQIRLGSVGFR